MNKFKVGDWVKVQGLSGDFIAKVSYVNSDGTLTLDGNGVAFSSQATLWEPSKDELGTLVWKMIGDRK